MSFPVEDILRAVENACWCLLVPQGQRLEPNQVRWLQVLAEERGGGSTLGASISGAASSTTSSTGSQSKAALVREVNELLQGVWQPPPQATTSQPGNDAPTSSGQHHNQPREEASSFPNHDASSSQGLSILGLHSAAGDNGVGPSISQTGQAMEAAPLIHNVPVSYSNGNGKGSSAQASLLQRRQQPTVPAELVEAALRCNSLVEQMEDPGGQLIRQMRVQWNPLPTLKSSVQKPQRAVF
jgi:hypothetical protein